ncbi:glycosyltransferase group 2 family protein [Bifidobacterium sp. DSM 109960]|uniref:Glycosyltransferase group 2 family protein n=1 Tax=Bifidobacterium erythrocebi TaxID=2675325 RepID=A0A7Y0EU09_9BIFI|nr:glycosyltransferase [Bifidobacterium sp. DSM 109960]NMM96412.1 glycosyltransferase group 2 family protein [Bifidobacterium sp. DSM 109960]
MRGDKLVGSNKAQSYDGVGCSAKEGNKPYSVLMSVYAKESPEFLAESLRSMLVQTVPPEQIVLVEDGPLTSELNAVIDSFCEQNKGLFDIVTLPKNEGLGSALAQGIPVCRNEIIARMDSDDYAFPTRMEKELAEMSEYHLDMVGSQIVEFISDPEHPVAKSDLPIDQQSIVSYSKRRNPFRHPSMVLRKSRVVNAGNYSADYLYFEDWDLFNRMLASGCKAANINEPLVAMRVSPDFYARRGGPSYIPHIWKFKTEQLRRGYFTFFQFLGTTIPHILVCLVPNSVRSFIYTKFLRKGAK